MIKKILLLVFFGCVFATNALALSRIYTYDDEGGGWPFVATFNIGPAWARPGEFRTITVQTNINKTFSPLPTSRALRFTNTARGTNTLISGEIFLGFYSLINQVVTAQIGLAVSASSQVKLKGNVLDDGNPAFNNFAYSYGVRNTRVGLKVKFLYDPNYYDLFPYLSASAGAGFNHSSGFHIRTRLFEEVAAPSFPDQGKTSFSYTIGTGLETPIDDNWRLGLGYEFADWGKSALGRAAAQSIGEGPFVNNLRTHELQVGISYVA